MWSIFLLYHSLMEEYFNVKVFIVLYKCVNYLNFILFLYIHSIPFIRLYNFF